MNVKESNLGSEDTSTHAYGVSKLHGQRWRGLRSRGLGAERECTATSYYRYPAEYLSYKEVLQQYGLVEATSGELESVDQLKRPVVGAPVLITEIIRDRDYGRVIEHTSY